MGPSATMSITRTVTIGTMQNFNCVNKGHGLKTLCVNRPLINPSAMCGGVGSATTEWQVVTSPGYPSDYPAEVRCRWTLEAPENEYVHVEITDLQVQESHPDCRADYVQFIYVPLVSEQTIAFLKNILKIILEDNGPFYRPCRKSTHF